jgi:endogenous inhibitor of DNA gyrase (YacG/DUF329 family)
MSTSAARPTRTVACPACGGPSLYSPDNPARPFCSVRCKQIDLGAWASEQFRVAARPPADDGVADDFAAGDTGPGDSRLQ